ncbi:glutathione S-transferase [Brasilonema sp. UFV-L1]|uniref:glutathione S-transferase family protein n=1 Tax=Brasilonema sp. UFV-L1 TaxID=2234130 RepID=UPI00145F5D76|nr:glutathione S-transferase [Brasilonema sp. UFV-L1]NMG08676.1 hypothetical protein [Brasilonema sp. UFV-L1]
MPDGTLRERLIAKRGGIDGASPNPTSTRTVLFVFWASRFIGQRLFKHARYDVELSGNCHKVRLMLSVLGLEYELVPVVLKGGEQKTEEFLKLNPLGQVPVLRDGDVVIRDAQAILVYLARRYGGEDWLPTEAESMSQVVQWLSTAANEIQHGVAALRKHFLLNAQIDFTYAITDTNVAYVSISRASTSGYYGHK